MSFTRQGSDLVAGNRRVWLTLAVVSGSVSEEGVYLSESADLNVSVALKGRSARDLCLLADGERVLCSREGGHLWGRFAPGSRVGEVRFEVVVDGRVALAAEVEVRPAKLDYRTHFQAMRAEVEAICRSLLYRMPCVIHERRSVTRADGQSAAEYLGILEGLFADLAQAVEAILRSPRRRLTRHSAVVEVSRARGRAVDGPEWIVRTPSVWVPKVATSLKPLPSKGGEVHYRAVREAMPQIDADTPENRLLLYVLTTLRRRLRCLVERGDPGAGDQARWIEVWGQMLSRVEAWLQDDLFKSVPPCPSPPDAAAATFDARYQRVLRIHRDLLRGLGDLRGRPFEVSFRDTPELYEYWVYLKLVDVFTSLGLKPVESFPALLLSEDALQITLGHGLDFAVRLASLDGMRVTLFYNRTYTTRSRASLTHDMRPDMACEVETRDGETTWVFDAKYRRVWDDGCWSPALEDIDRMHTYRDGIGKVDEDGRFRRCLGGAFVLFPAEWDEAYLAHRFCRSIEYGIGGFPLMPGDERTAERLGEWIKKNIFTAENAERSKENHR